MFLRPFLVLGIWLFLQTLVAGIAVSSSHTSERHTTRSLNTRIQEELASVLSPNATITDPHDAEWADVTERYMQQVKPHVQFSVSPGEEDDVLKIVRFANDHDISFYAVNRGHALTASVEKFNGIEINMRSLNSIHVKSNKKTALFQGGVYGHEVLETLWDKGFVTATGVCSCVGLLGPALGGGHGLQQGRHGLTADHFVNLNVVLASGTAVQVNERSHPDLWWAMRGAGHNFGIVTSFESKIWRDNFRNYFVKSYQFDGNSLELLMERINEFNTNGPGDTLDPTWLGSFGVYTMNSTISQTEAIISWVFFYDGPEEEAAAALEPFDALGPLSMSTANVPYPALSNQIVAGVNDPVCEPNKTHIIGTAGLEVYNITAMRAIYDLYNEKVNQHPRLGDTRVLLESYAVQAMQNFNSDNSAFPFRDDNILTYFDVKFDTANDPLTGFAEQWRDETVNLWNAGQPQRKPTVYVNYARGGESLEARYGYEPWRLERLRKLKRRYDPENKFAWYNPIVPPVV